MWKRSELKLRGNAAFKANRGNSIVASLLLLLSTSGMASTNIQPILTNMEEILSKLNADEALAILGMLAQVAIVSSIVTTLLDILVFNPLEVGGSRFFLVSSDDSSTSLSEFKFPFNARYGNIVLTIFLRDLYNTLWFLVFFFPGIVKAYSYRLVPYILADHPELDANEAITLSRKMMKGNKMKTFVLDLSFLGWSLLGIITLGIVAIVYTYPYINATNAELYKAIREESEEYRRRFPPAMDLPQDYV